MSAPARPLGAPANSGPRSPSSAPADSGPRFPSSGALADPAVRAATDAWRRSAIARLPAIARGRAVGRIERLAGERPALCHAPLLYAALAPDTAQGDAGASARAAAFALDAFWGELADGDDVVLGDAGGGLVLPECGVRLPVRARRVWRNGLDSLGVRTPEGDLIVSLRRPGAFAYPALAVAGWPSALVLLAVPPAMSRSSLAARAEIARGAGPAFADALAEAFSLLERASPGLPGACAHYVRYFLPLAAEAPSTRASFTCADAPGVVFLTATAEASWLAETIVHEAAHAALHALAAQTPLAGGDEEARFYSPWRDDPRPLTSVLHGAFAFGEVAAVLAALAAAGDEGARRRLVLTAHRARLALAEAPEGLLTDAGRALVASIRRRLDALFARHELGAELPISLRAHLLAWRATNAGLAGRSFTRVTSTPTDGADARTPPVPPG